MCNLTLHTRLESGHIWDVSGGQGYQSCIRLKNREKGKVKNTNMIVAALVEARRHRGTLLQVESNRKLRGNRRMITKDRENILLNVRHDNPP